MAQRIGKEEWRKRKNFRYLLLCCEWFLFKGWSSQVRGRENDFSTGVKKTATCIPLVWGRQKRISHWCEEARIAISLNTDSKILSKIESATLRIYDTVLWKTGLNTYLTLWILLRFWKFAALNSAHKTSFSLGGVSFLYYIFCWRHALRSIPLCVT